MKFIIKLMPFIPWSYIIAFYSYVLRVAWDLGRLPYYNNPDPSYIYVEHRTIINGLFELSFWGSLVCLMLIVLFRKTVVFQENNIYLRSFFVGIIMIIYNIFFDPFETWYLD